MKFLKNSKIAQRFQQLDQYLLLNNRILWETKAHYLAAYLLVSASVIILVGSLQIDVQLTRELPEVTGFSNGILIVNIIALGYWLYKLSHHSIEQNFGKGIRFIEQSKFLIYFLGIFLLGASSFIPSLIVQSKVKSLVSHDQLLHDIKVLNEGNIYFPIRRSSVTAYNADNIFAVRDQDDIRQYDNTYFGYSNDDLKYIYSKKTIREAPDVNALITRSKERGDAIQTIDNFLATFDKYCQPFVLQVTSKEIFKRFCSESSVVGVQLDKYLVKRRIREIRNTIRGRAEATLEIPFYVGLLTLTIASFWLAILTQIGKHTGLKIVLAGGVCTIAIVMSLASLMAAVGSFEFGLFITFVSIIVLVIQTAAISYARHFSYLKIIALIVLQVFSPLLLLYLASFNADALNEQSILIYLFIGFGLYIVFYLPVFRKAYLRLRALPKLK